MTRSQKHKPREKGDKPFVAPVNRERLQEAKILSAEIVLAKRESCSPGETPTTVSEVSKSGFAYKNRKGCDKEAKRLYSDQILSYAK